MSSWGGSDGDTAAAESAGMSGYEGGQRGGDIGSKIGSLFGAGAAIASGYGLLAKPASYVSEKFGRATGNAIGSWANTDNNYSGSSYHTPGAVENYSTGGYSLGSAGINSSSGANMGTDWGSLGSAAIGLGTSLYGNYAANKAADNVSKNYTSSALSNAAQENAWNRENAAWSMGEQERINKEQRQWELANNASINQEGRQWQLDNNERLGQEYRDWNLNTNRDITDQNQKWQMDMLKQNRPNQNSDFGNVAWSTDANGNPVQTSSLAPQLQEQLGALRGKYGDMIGGLDSGGFGVNNDVMGAIRGLQESGLSQNEDAQRARYAAMGIPLQSSANDRGEQNLSRTRTDADLQAILAGNTAWQQGQANTRDNLQSMAGLETTWNNNMNNIPGYSLGNAAQQGGFTANAPQAQNNFYTAGGTPAGVPSYQSAGLGSVALNAMDAGNNASQAIGQGWNQVGQAGIDVWKSLFPGDNKNA